MPSSAEAEHADYPSISYKRGPEEGTIYYYLWDITSLDDYSLPPPKRQKHIPSRHSCPYENCGKSYTKPCRLTDHLQTHTETVYSIAFVSNGSVILNVKFVEPHLPRETILHPIRKHI